MHPLGRLNPPGNYDELVTESVTDVLPGIVGWINDAVAWVTRQFGHEVNVVHWLTETVGGDWGDLLSIADAWNNLAWASSDIAANLTAGVVELDPHWDGNAAQAFKGHMVKWHNAFVENRLTCETVRDTLRDLATVAKEFLQAVIDLLQMLFSILGTGGPIVAVMRAVEIADGVIKAYRVYDAVKKTIQAAVSIFEMIAADRPDHAPSTRVEVPSTSYGGPDAPGRCDEHTRGARRTVACVDCRVAELGWRGAAGWSGGSGSDPGCRANRRDRHRGVPET